MLEATRELYMDQPASVGMEDIAARAEVSTATVYRHFSSLDDLVTATVYEIVCGFRDYSLGQSETGEDLMHRIMVHWVGVVKEDGAVLIQLRSRRGFLERVDDCDPVITATVEAWSRPIREFLGDELSDFDLIRAIMFLNQIIDPREIRDLIEFGVRSSDKISRVVTDTFRAGILPWLEHTQGLSLPQSLPSSSNQGLLE